MQLNEPANPKGVPNPETTGKIRVKGNSRKTRSHQNIRGERTHTLNRYQGRTRNEICR